MNVETWVKTKAEQILKEIGIKEAYKILDFGCGPGIYTTIISNIIGDKGKIHALDYNDDKLEELRLKIKKTKINNVNIIKSSKEVFFPIQDNSLDVVIVYDVWHLLDDNQRIKLLKEIQRTLKKGGFVSYLATHIDEPNVRIEKVHKLMKKYGLILLEKHIKPMFHWSWIEEYQIFNYFKK